MKATIRYFSGEQPGAVEHFDAEPELIRHHAALEAPTSHGLRPDRAVIKWRGDGVTEMVTVKSCAKDFMMGSADSPLWTDYAAAAHWGLRNP